jgi:hypothetical protein
VFLFRQSASRGCNLQGGLGLEHKEAQLRYDDPGQLTSWEPQPNLHVNPIQRKPLLFSGLLLFIKSRVMAYI